MPGLKLNLNPIKNREIEEQQKKDEAKRISDEVKMKLAKDFEEDMYATADSIEIDEEDIEKNIKEFKKLKRNKIILLSSIVTTFAIICICSIYNVFFKHEYSQKEIAAIAKEGNNLKNFPCYGVQGYLDNNIEELMDNYISSTTPDLKKAYTVKSNSNKVKINEDATKSSSVTDDKDIFGNTSSTDSSSASRVTKLWIENPSVTEIIAKSDNFANVYFTLDLCTNIGTDRVNCMIPLVWNGLKYMNAGSVIITATISTDNIASDQKTEENIYSSFEDCDQETEELTQSAQKFINSFFTILYSGGDPSSFYSSTVSLDPEIANKLSYGGLTSFKLYTSANKNGFNAYAKILLTTPNGVSYTTDKYFLITKNGDNWMIKGIQ